MSHVVDNPKYQRSPVLYKLEKFENSLRKQVDEISMRKLPDSKVQIEAILKNSQKELNKIGQDIRGINWFAFLFGFAAYHLQNIYRNKILLNEMGMRAPVHIAICSAVGLATGALVGYNTASNFKLYRKFNMIKKRVNYSLNH